MGLFSAIGGIFDAVTDVAGAIAPVVGMFNPAVGAGLSAVQGIDEAVNKGGSSAEAEAFEAAMGQASLIFASDQLAMMQELEAEGDEYIEEAVNGE